MKMPVSCKHCHGDKQVKNGRSRGFQRYKCKRCGKNFIMRDARKDKKYSNKERQLAIRMYLNNCGFRRISAILETPLSTVFSWIKKAGRIVDEMVKNREEEGGHIEVLEMDELYTYIKKKRIEHEYGLLLIGRDSKLLRLK
jgi:transposase-like protein